MPNLSPILGQQQAQGFQPVLVGGPGPASPNTPIVPAPVPQTPNAQNPRAGQDTPRAAVRVPNFLTDSDDAQNSIAQTVTSQADNTPASQSFSPASFAPVTVGPSATTTDNTMFIVAGIVGAVLLLLLLVKRSK